MQTIWSRLHPLLPGLAIAGCIAAASMMAATLPSFQRWAMSALTLAIMGGMVLGNTAFPKIAPSCLAGIDFSKTRLLRLGVILYGFRITFQQIGDIGLSGIVIDLAIICLTFSLAVLLGTRVFKLDRETAMLIGAGSSICGAAAVMATEPVVRGQAPKVSVAVATVVVFGTLAMFLYPLLYPYLHLSETAYGIYAGSTIHEVAQVIVAGKAVSEHAAETAVIEKMLRIMMLAPFLVTLSIQINRKDTTGNGIQRITIPWFAVLFIAASGIHSLQVLPGWIIDVILQMDTVLLAMAMAALGLQTQAREVRQAGLKPILLAGSLFTFLMVGGYVINKALSLLN